jgi:hypothetical protein
MKLSTNLFSSSNKTRIIGLLTILILLWLILYFIPDVLNLLFNTLLGNLILLTVSVLLLMYNIKYGLIVSLILIVIYRFSHISKNNEGFTWNKESEKNFLLIQQSINPKIIFDIDTIKETQASQEEVDYFNKNNAWPWSQTTKDLYIEALRKNPYIRTLPEDGLNGAMRVYNENAILRILSYQTKEGQFLLNGVLVPDSDTNINNELPNGFGDFAYNSNLQENKSYDIIKCNMNNDTNITLERIKYDKNKKETASVDYTDLESIIPGFSFVNSPCNPCVALKSSPDYSCPFRLIVKDNPPFISNVWQYLWNINVNPLQPIEE